MHKIVRSSCEKVESMHEFGVATIVVCWAGDARGASTCVLCLVRAVAHRGAAWRTGRGVAHKEQELHAEAQCRRIDPCEPTAAERAAREATQLPLRSWCAECVAVPRDILPPRKQERLSQ